MSQLHPAPSVTGTSESQEILPFGINTEDVLPSFSSILGAGSDDTVGLTPETLSRRISAINEFYEGMEAPYLSAETLIRKTLAQKNNLYSLLRSDKKQQTGIELEIAELQDSLAWALKKVSVLEEERKALISKLQ